MKMQATILVRKMLRACVLELAHAFGKMALSIMATGIKTYAMEMELTALATLLLFMKVLGLTTKSTEKGPKNRKVEL